MFRSGYQNPAGSIIIARPEEYFCGNGAGKNSGKINYNFPDTG